MPTRSRGRYNTDASFVTDGNSCGLYLLDEPEAALSAMRQLTFISALKQMIQENSQFIIATHSPILLAFPDAQILQFSNGAIREVQYNELEHVQLTEDFLNNPESFLRHL